MKLLRGSSRSSSRDCGCGRSASFRHSTNGGTRAAAVYTFMSSTRRLSCRCARRLALITTIRRLWPNEFAWRDPPYEYETVKRPIDILFGNVMFREALERDAVKTPADLDELLFLDKAAWRKQVAAHLLYGG